MNARASSNRYLDELRRVRSARAAATLVRAFEVSIAGPWLERPADLRSMIERAQMHADTLERPWAGPGRHPWRTWLREWGYVQDLTPARQL